MLQIVTKMYFRPGVPLHSTVQRAVLHTNRSFLRGGVIDLPVGELAPSTMLRPVSTVTVSITEHLEAEGPDGESSILIATTGEELIDQLADVLSFSLDAVFSRDGDLVKRLVPDSFDPNSRASGAARLFRRTFEPARHVEAGELVEVERFLGKLLMLERKHFEAALKAIRRIVGATQRAVDDPTIAYVDLVAALESLGTEGAPAPSWEQVDGAKRKLIDPALEGLETDTAERVRQAIMEAEKVGASSRYLKLVTDNITPNFYRNEAVGTVKPIRGPDLERALKLAYGIRSRSVHALEELPPEAWIFGEGAAETAEPVQLGIMLSHEGLRRLAHHVVRNYVDRAPAGVDASFNWRASLPGQILARLAPEYWIWSSEGFDRGAAGRYFSGLVETFVDAGAGRKKGLPDMRDVLMRVEETVPGLADGPEKVLMVALYALWHLGLRPEHHLDGAEAFLGKHDYLLGRPEMPAFCVRVLEGALPDWSDQQWRELGAARRLERSRRRHLELPSGFDAVLQMLVAGRMHNAGNKDEALATASFAVEEKPGDEYLLAWEAELREGAAQPIDVRAVLFGVQADAQPAGGESEETPSA